MRSSSKRQHKGCRLTSVVHQKSIHMWLDMKEQSCALDTRIGCRRYRTHWKQRRLKLPLYMPRNVRPHPGSQTLASNLSKTQKHVHDMFTHSLVLAWPSPKHAGSTPTAVRRLARSKSPQEPPTPARDCRSTAAGYLHALLPVRGRKVSTVQSPPLPGQDDFSSTAFFAESLLPEQVEKVGSCPLPRFSR